MCHLVAEALWALMHINEIGYCHTPTAIHTKLEQERKRKRSKNMGKDQRITGKHQRNFFTFAFTFTRSEHSFNTVDGMLCCRFHKEDTDTSGKDIWRTFQEGKSRGYQTTGQTGVFAVP